MRILAALFATVFLMGCGSSEVIKKTLDMNAWEVVQIGAKSLEDMDSDQLPTMAFDMAKGQISGSTGCNSYSGSFSADEFGTEIGPVAATKKACPDMKIETMFLEALGNVARIDMGDDMIRLFNASGVEVMEARAK